MATSTTALTAEEEATAAALPVFSTRELQVCKADSRNRMTFGVPAHSSMLLQLRRPKPHAYEEKDHRWLHLLEAVAAVPSRKVDMIQKLVVQSLQLLPSPVWKQNLEKSVRALLAQLEGAKDDFYKRALVTLQLKDRVAQFLREWLADPIEGFVLTKEHIVGEFDAKCVHTVVLCFSDECMCDASCLFLCVCVHLQRGFDWTTWSRRPSELATCVATDARMASVSCCTRGATASST